MRNVVLEGSRERQSTVTRGGSKFKRVEKTSLYADRNDSMKRKGNCWSEVLE